MNHTIGPHFYSLKLNTKFLSAAVTNQATTVVGSLWQTAVSVAVCKAGIMQYPRKNLKTDTESRTFTILVYFKNNFVAFPVIKLIKINTPNREFYDTRQYQSQNMI